MLQAWRIVKAKHASIAFSGEGAAKAGGRWNSKGTRVIYCSATKSLAALETLVHINPPVPFKYLVFRIKFDARLVEHPPIRMLPEDWQAEPPPPSTKEIGDNWCRKSRSAVLAVPSVIVPDELNYLLNPVHPHFKKISIGKPERFAFDPRLLQ
ncbi:MAG TPA: RES family NAD+ phosphorylase [Verrucomicrobiae bacterium]|nr:RES family NAD+ phosphorylase [Verrucomicrobiae bacterium]